MNCLDTLHELRDWAGAAPRGAVHRISIKAGIGYNTVRKILVTREQNNPKIQTLGKIQRAVKEYEHARDKLER